MAGGRPTKYRAEFAQEAYKLCLLGLTDAELAEYFGATEQTVNNWKLNHPEFFESLKRGKENADSEIAQKLYHRAKGYEHPEEQIFQYQGEPVIVPTIKRYPPDTTAAIFWLKNRQPQKWRDKQELEHTGPGGGPMEIAQLTPEERQARIDDLIKRREGGK